MTDRNYFQRLKEISLQAFQESPFYREVLKRDSLTLEKIQEDWNQIPVIRKAELVLAKDTVIPPKYYPEERKGRIVSETTSGSTGQCLKIYWNKAQLSLSMLPLWLKRKWYYDILPSDRYCYFYTLHNPYGEEPEEEQKGNGLGFSKMNLSEERIAEIYQRMVDYDPVWMVLQPGIAILLARYRLENGAEEIASLKYIELTGEMVTVQNKNFIKNVFGCSVAGQYGSYEVNSIAYECPAGHLHILDENVYVEIFRNGCPVKEGEEGEIVITSLHNRVMPFIRYDIGDWGRIKKVSCQWNTANVLELTRGRKNDRVLCEDGSHISVYEFVKIFGSICEQIDGEILQYQVEQKGFREFHIHIVAEERPEEIERLFFLCIQNPYLKECEYQFYYHNRLLPDDTTGKLRMFRSFSPT